MYRLAVHILDSSKAALDGFALHGDGRTPRWWLLIYHFEDPISYSTADERFTKSVEDISPRTVDISSEKSKPV